MDEAIGKVCKSLATFSNHLQSSCDALKQSVDRRPIPLDSASTTFTRCLNERVTSASSDLNMLESMAFETVSFEELLGHCSEIFKKNQNDLLALRSSSSAFIPFSEADIDIEDVDDDGERMLMDDSSNYYDSSSLSSTAQFEDDPLFDDSVSLKNLGLSDVCLATIASEANNKIDIKESYQPATNRLEMIGGKIEEDLKPCEEPKLIKVSKDDYENLPKHMRSLASWEDLLVAVEKVNSYLRTKKSKADAFQQDEISALQLGHKARSYLLLLLRLNRLIIETIDGFISYRVVNC